MIGWLCGLHPACQRVVLVAIIGFGAIWLPGLSYIVFGGIAIWWGPDLLSDFCQRRHSASWVAKITADNEELRQELAQVQNWLLVKIADLTEAESVAFQLRAELATARRQQSAPPVRPPPENKSSSERLYGRLGLTPDVPNAFLPHIRRAVALELHPDKRPEHLREAAHVRFVDAMNVLDQIEKDRAAPGSAASRSA